MSGYLCGNGKLGSYEMLPGRWYPLAHRVCGKALNSYFKEIRGSFSIQSKDIKEEFCLYSVGT